MKVNLTQRIVITLELERDEAVWLHGVMQNPLHGQSPDQESTEDSLMRNRFFNATNAVDS